MSSCTAMTSLNLHSCVKVADEGMRAVSSLTALTSLNLTCCREVSDEGIRAVTASRR